MDMKKMQASEVYGSICDVQDEEIPVITDGKDDYARRAHQHLEVQLLLVKSTGIRVIIENKHYQVQPNEVLFINSNRPHAVLQTERAGGIISIKFNPSITCGGMSPELSARYLRPVTENVSLPAVLLRGDPALEVGLLISEINKWKSEKPIFYELKIRLNLTKIWMNIYSSALTSSESLNSASYSDRKRIEELCNYIHQNYEEKISLQDIADAAHISKGECCRIFRRLMYTTPAQYLTSYRLSKSQILLAETEDSIAQIAQSVGFCSSSYYTKCFRKEYGFAPHQYRNKR